MAERIDITDIELITLLKKVGVLVPIVPGSTVNRVDVSISALCNSGFQFGNRHEFLRQHVAQVPHYVPKHGGIMRLSQQDDLYSQAFEDDLREAANLLSGNFQRFTGGGHYPCVWGGHKGLDFLHTLIQSYHGFQRLREIFLGVTGVDFLFFFHIDYSTWEGDKKNPMEMFLVNPELLKSLYRP